MRFQKVLAAFVAGIILVPLAASAQITLTALGQAQVASLATQLVSILGQLAQAQALGPSYTSSPSFEAQAAVWRVQLSQISTQLISVISTSVVTNPYAGSTST